jgi:hypothetical protein
MEFLQQAAAKLVQQAVGFYCLAIAQKLVS